MKNIKLKKIAGFYLVLMLSNFSIAQHNGHPKLHVNYEIDDCSFQIDSSLTQGEWRKFTKETGLVAYFRPLIDAKPMGKWNFEIALMQWKTKIDDSEGAWNNTFAHPDSTHWLKQGERLPIPGLCGRIGLTDKIDLGLYFTQNPKANYGLLGCQVQYNFLKDTSKKYSASARVSYNSIFGPKDLSVNIYGIDLVASKEIKLLKKTFISPYAGVSSYLSSTHEKTGKVNLKDENILGAQAMFGVSARIYFARIGLEYNFSNTSTYSFKIGMGF